MSKGLKSLNKLDDIISELACELKKPSELYPRDYGQLELISDIYKELKALEIINIKRVPIPVIFEFDTYDDYWEWAYSNVIRLYLLSREEFKLLKEVLINE